MMNEGYRLCQGCNRNITVSSRGIFLPHKNKNGQQCPMSGKVPGWDICDFCGKKIPNPDNKVRYCSEDCEKKDSRRHALPVDQEISKRKLKSLKYSDPLYFN